MSSCRSSCPSPRPANPGAPVVCEVSAGIYAYVQPLLVTASHGWNAFVTPRIAGRSSG
jgi:hypothetical protein